jgi:hypothetical protein
MIVLYRIFNLGACCQHERTRLARAAPAGVKACLMRRLLLARADVSPAGPPCRDSFAELDCNDAGSLLRTW